jgi:hypothetical protein
MVRLWWLLDTVRGKIDHRLDLQVDWIDQLDARVDGLEFPFAGAVAAPVQPDEGPREEDEEMAEVIDP